MGQRGKEKPGIFFYSMGNTSPPKLALQQLRTSHLYLTELLQRLKADETCSLPYVKLI